MIDANAVIVNAVIAALQKAERLLNDRLVDEINRIAEEQGEDCNFEAVPDLDEARGLVIDALELLGQKG